MQKENVMLEIAEQFLLNPIWKVLRDNQIDHKKYAYSIPHKQPEYKALDSNLTISSKNTTMFINSHIHVEIHYAFEMSFDITSTDEPVYIIRPYLVKATNDTHCVYDSRHVNNNINTHEHLMIVGIFTECINNLTKLCSVDNLLDNEFVLNI